MDPDSVARTLAFLRSEYDYVIVDCATSLDETNLAVIEGSSQVYLVATPEIGSIRDLSRYVDKLMQIEFTTEKMHVVINRFSSRYAVNIEQIEKAIHLPVAIKLPNSYTELVRSVNLGEPIAPQRKSEFAMQFTKWAMNVVGSSGVSLEHEAPRKGLFAKWV
jgi:pilus assembly protein CpaE